MHLLRIKNQSLAGKFESFLNIENNSKNISKYVEKIILQYKKYDASKKTVKFLFKILL